MRASNERARGKLIEGRQGSSQEIDELKAKIQDMELEIDILKETVEILKKRPRCQHGAVMQYGKSSDR